MAKVVSNEFLEDRIQIHIDLDGNDIAELLKGGAGSGNFNHTGRPGKVGGSGGSVGGSSSDGKEDWGELKQPLTKDEDHQLGVWRNMFGVVRAYRMIDAEGSLDNFDIPLTESQKKFYIDEHKTFLEGVKKLPDYKGTAFRVLKDVDAEDSFPVGSVFENLSHSSTSVSSLASNRYGTDDEKGKGIVKLEIKMKRGADMRAAVAASNSNYKANEGDQEVLMLPNTKYKVLSHEKRTETDPNGKQFEATYIRVEQQ